VCGRFLFIKYFLKSLSEGNLLQLRRAFFCLARIVCWIYNFCHYVIMNVMIGVRPCYKDSREDIKCKAYDVMRKKYED